MGTTAGRRDKKKRKGTTRLAWGRTDPILPQNKGEGLTRGPHARIEEDVIVQLWVKPPRGAEVRDHGEFSPGGREAKTSRG